MPKQLSIQHLPKEFTMKPIAVNLDHVGTIVADLHSGKTKFEKLGFTLTARSQHRGAVEPGGPIQPFGQANHCAMLKQGYLEILGIIDSSMPTPASSYLEKYEGPHIVAMRPSSIDSVIEMSRNGGPMESPRKLGREVLFGPAGDEQRPVNFINVQFRGELFPEAKFLFTEHLTRDVMWQPHLLEHANKVVALECVYVSSPNPEEMANRLSVAFNMQPQVVVDGHFLFPFESSSLALVTPAVWQKLFPGSNKADIPRPMGYAVRTESIDSVIDVLSENQVPFQRTSDGGVFVMPEYACGNVIQFIEKE